MVLRLGQLRRCDCQISVRRSSTSLPADSSSDEKLGGLDHGLADLFEAAMLEDPDLVAGEPQDPGDLAVGPLGIEEEFHALEGRGSPAIA